MFNLQLNETLKLSLGLVLRHSLGILGGVLMEQGRVTAEDWTTVQGAAAVVLAVTWSYLEKRNKKARV